MVKLRHYKISVCVAAFLSFAAHIHTYAQISPDALKDIQLLEAEKKSRTPTESKLTSQLLQAYRESQGKPMAEGVELDKVKLPTDNSGNVLLDINAKVSDKLLAEIKVLGGNVLASSVKYHALRASLPVAQLLKLASLKEVTFVKIAAKKHMNSIKQPNKETNPLNYNFVPKPDNTFNVPKGPKIPFAIRAERVKAFLKSNLVYVRPDTLFQGDHTMQVDSARSKFGYTGKGIRIGVMSDNYNSQKGAPTDIANGLLPGVGNPYGYTTPVTVVQDDLSTSGTDEGRAMLQIVHELVPDAQLYFATADNGDAGFASNIEALANSPNNCDVIVDDVGYSDEPAFQDGPIAQAVTYVAKKGVMYFSSAGNGGSQLYNLASVWEGDFNGVKPTTLPKALDSVFVHNFGTAAKPIYGDSIITTSGDYSLMWSDPLGGSTNDYDLYLISAATARGRVIASSTNKQTGTQDPFEEITPTNDRANYLLVVVQHTGAQNRAIRLESHLDGQGKGMTHTTNGGTVGHPATDSAMGVAAVDASAYYPGVFTTASTVENFSDDGPRHVFYTPDSLPITPGNLLYSTNGGKLLNKPNISAADGVGTLVAGTNNGFYPFYGTSAAAPHAASIAALIKSAKPTMSASDIKKLMAATAIDIQAPGFDFNSGYGIANAYAAMNALLNTTTAPVISYFTPTQGQAGTVVTIHGTGLGGLTKVSFGGLSVSYNNIGDSIVTATVLTGSTGYVTVANTLGSDSLPGFTFLCTPVNPNIKVSSNLYLGDTISLSAQWPDSIWNPYDGIYSMKGYIYRAGGAAQTGHFAPVQRQLITMNDSTVVFDSAQVWADGTLVAVGNPVLAVNSQDSVNITATPLTTGLSTQVGNYPSYASYFNPKTKTFYVGFTYTTTAGLRYALDTLTYISPRYGNAYNWQGPSGFSSNNNDTIVAGVTTANSGTYYINSSLTPGCTSKDSALVNVIDSLQLGGYVLTPSGQPVPTVTITNPLNTLYTDSNGHYLTTLSPYTGQFVISPTKNNDSIKSSGVDITDVLLIQDHILGKIPLTNPLNLIAADVNGDGVVDVVDILLIERLILGIDTTFINSTTSQKGLWAFVDNSYHFADSANPWSFANSDTLTSPQSSNRAKSFTGIKLGDVNADYSSVNIVKKPHNPTSDRVEIFYDSVKSTDNSTITLQVRAKGFKNLKGMQIGLHFNPKVFNNVVASGHGIPIKSKIDNEKGIINLLWADKKNEALTLSDNTVLFDIQLTPTTAYEKEDISIGSDKMETFAINSNMKAVEVLKTNGGLRGTKQTLAPISLESISIAPNPSHGQISLRLTTKQEKDVQLELINAVGKKVWNKTIRSVQGSSDHSINFKNNYDLKPGTYYLKAIGLDNNTMKTLVIE